MHACTCDSSPPDRHLRWPRGRYLCPKGATDCTATTPGATLLCRERPVYGGSGKSSVGFDEPGYILQPPCLWGGAAHGLEPPVDVDGAVLHSVKTSNATYGHHGEV